MTRETGPSAVRLIGDRVRALSFLARARTLMGRMKDSLEGRSGVHRWPIEPGVVITTSSNPAGDFIVINVALPGATDTALGGLVLEPINDEFPNGLQPKPQSFLPVASRDLYFPLRAARPETQFKAGSIGWQNEGRTVRITFDGPGNRSIVFERASELSPNIYAKGALIAEAPGKVIGAGVFDGRYLVVAVLSELGDSVTYHYARLINDLVIRGERWIELVTQTSVGEGDREPFVHSMAFFSANCKESSFVTVSGRQIKTKFVRAINGEGVTVSGTDKSPADGAVYTYRSRTKTTLNLQESIDTNLVREPPVGGVGVGTATVSTARNASSEITSQIYKDNQPIEEYSRLLFVDYDGNKEVKVFIKIKFIQQFNSLETLSYESFYRNDSDASIGSATTFESESRSEKATYRAEIKIGDHYSVLIRDEEPETITPFTVFNAVYSGDALRGQYTFTGGSPAVTVRQNDNISHFYDLAYINAVSKIVILRKRFINVDATTVSGPAVISAGNAKDYRIDSSFTSTARITRIAANDFIKRGELSALRDETTVEQTASSSPNVIIGESEYFPSAPFPPANPRNINESSDTISGNLVEEPLALALSGQGQGLSSFAPQEPFAHAGLTRALLYGGPSLPEQTAMSSHVPIQANPSDGSLIYSFKALRNQSANPSEAIYLNGAFLDGNRPVSLPDRFTALPAGGGLRYRKIGSF